MLTLVCWLALSSQGRAPGAPADPDTDRDGLSDFQELHKYLTDPAVADSDKDGTPDGDWDERREYAYTVRTLVRVVGPASVDAVDDYQDARVTDRGEDWVELEAIHYPLGTAGEALEADPEWRAHIGVQKEYQESTATSSFDGAMRSALLAELSADGLAVETADDLTLAGATARRLLARSTSEDGFTTFFADFKNGKASVPPALAAVVREREEQAGRSVEEQWERELFARGMFKNRVHGSCTSSAIYLAGGLRAAGLPARLVLMIPVVDANDPSQVALLAGLRHHRVRGTAQAGIEKLAGSWSSHTMNEVWVGGRWRRLNYGRLGQPILDENLFGLTTHVLTLRDWADARMGRSVGRRQGLELRDDVFRTQNPYATLELSDEFGAHARVENPEAGKPPEAVTLERAFWAASPERPAHLAPSGIDLERDTLHVFLAARASTLELKQELLDPFWSAVPKTFTLVAPSGELIPAEAVRGMWFGASDAGPYLYFLLRLAPEDRARLAPGLRYVIEPAQPAAGPRFLAAEGLALTPPLF